MREIEVLKELDHPYIMKLYNSFTMQWPCYSFPGRPPVDRDYLVMDLEFCESSLLNLIIDREEQESDKLVKALN